MPLLMEYTFDSAPPALWWATGDTAGLTTAARNICALHRLERLAVAFNAAGIPLLLLKGAALNLALQLPPHARPMSDLDILVPLEDVTRAADLLTRLGARRGPVLVQPDFCPRFYYEQEFHVGDVQPTRLDLHARPFRPLRYARVVPPSAFWTHAQPIQLGRARILLPAPADMLLHLATHAAVHAFADPRWLSDVRQWLTAYGPTLDWDYLAETAAAWHLVLPLRQSLARLGPNAGVPPEFTDRVQRLPVSRRDRLALWQAPRDAAHPVQHILVDALVGGGWHHIAAYLAAVLVPSRAHMADWYHARHPGWLWWAYVWRTLRGPLAGLRKVVTRFRSAAPSPTAAANRVI
jgi:hypothetical protein